MKTTIAVACCALSGLGGAAIATMATATAAPRVSTVTHTGLKGGYIIGDGEHCPKNTVAVNALVRLETNSQSGHSTSTLCYIKR